MAIGANKSATRRAFLRTGSGIGIGVALPARSTSAVATDFHLRVEPAAASLAGPDYPRTPVWAYDASVPGPILRLRQGKPARIWVENRLPEGTTVHWHGIRLPVAMDGVPGLTQPLIEPGKRFLYEFTPPDAGTFWYHPHANSLRQLGQGLAGALIVEEATPVAIDRDVLWVLGDWRLQRDGQFAPGFGSPMEAAMAGRIGNTVTINGTVSDAEPVRAGERIRLRLVNTALARIMALRFDGHQPVIVAVDGQPCAPHAAPQGRVVLGPAMRMDLIIDMAGDPGERFQVVDGFYNGRAYRLTELVYATGKPLRRHPLDAPVALPCNPLAEPNLAGAEPIEIRLTGGMMGGMGRGGMGAGGMGGSGVGGPGMGRTATWAVNDVSMTGDGHAGMAPLRALTIGRSYRLVLRNQTAFWHPMHLHGHSFRLERRDGEEIAHRQWADTVLVGPRETVEVAFVADNPGDWMLHCHVTDHQVSGMMTVLRVS